MPSPANEPVVVSANAGILDLLSAAGRYLVVIVAAIPVLLKLLGTHDFIAIVAYFKGADGVSLITAAGGLFALAYGLYKSHKRGAQIATVADDRRVPDSVAQIK